MLFIFISEFVNALGEPENELEEEDEDEKEELNWIFLYVYNIYSSKSILSFKESFRETFRLQYIFHQFVSYHVFNK